MMNNNVERVIEAALDWIEKCRNIVLYPLANKNQDSLGADAEGLGGLSVGVTKDLRELLKLIQQQRVEGNSVTMSDDEVENCFPLDWQGEYAKTWRREVADNFAKMFITNVDTQTQGQWAVAVETANAAIQTKRVPLTQEQLDACWDKAYPGIPQERIDRFARTVEVAHGIGAAAPSVHKESACKQCGGTGSIFAIDGSGPFDCYECGRKVIPAAPTVEVDFENELEKAYWNMDAMVKGYGEWKLRPKSERDAFKAVVRSALAKVTQRVEPFCEDEGCPHHGTKHICVEKKAAAQLSDTLPTKIATAVLEHCYGSVAVSDNMVERASVVVANLLASQPKTATTLHPLKVVINSYPESNGKRNWTAMFKRQTPWDGLVGSSGGITIDRGEYWNRVAYHAERARVMLGERQTEPDIIQYGKDVSTPEEWTGHDEESLLKSGGFGDRTDHNH